MAGTNQKSDKRRAIIEAALDLIAANGFHGTPTSKIAAKAGVGTGSLYRYFKDKEDLIHQVFQHVIDQMSKAILRDRDPSAPFREQYLRLGFNTFNFLVKNPKIQAFNEQYFNSPFGVSHKRDLLLVNSSKKERNEFHTVSDLLAPARDQQIVKELPLAVLMALIFGPIVFLARDVSSGVLELDPETVQKTIEACWDAVKR
ncbi:MAG: TetR/AcrR family transcriptional regulator [Desulfatiglandaceae bacterium]